MSNTKKFLKSLKGTGKSFLRDITNPARSVKTLHRNVQKVIEYDSPESVKRRKKRKKTIDFNKARKLRNKLV